MQDLLLFLTFVIVNEKSWGFRQLGFGLDNKMIHPSIMEIRVSCSHLNQYPGDITMTPSRSLFPTLERSSRAAEDIMQLLLQAEY